MPLRRLEGLVLRLVKAVALSAFVAVAVFWFAIGVAAYWGSLEECLQGRCYPNWDSPFLLFSLKGQVNDGNFLFITLGGLWLFLSGVILGHESRDKA